MARRQRFIALALSGLAASCGDDGTTTDGDPMPCLIAAPTSTDDGIDDETADGASASETGGGNGSGTADDGTTGGPDSDSDSDSGSSTEASGSGSTTGEEEETGTTGRPMPCLAPKG